MEYKHLTEEEIKRIYIEETGNNPPAQIHVYHSENFKNVNVKDFGFDGTIIHFYDEEKPKQINSSGFRIYNKEGSYKWYRLNNFFHLIINQTSEIHNSVCNFFFVQIH